MFVQQNELEVSCSLCKIRVLSELLGHEFFNLVDNLALCSECVILGEVTLTEDFMKGSLSDSIYIIKLKIRIKVLLSDHIGALELRVILVQLHKAIDIVLRSQEGYLIVMLVVVLFEHFFKLGIEAIVLEIDMRKDTALNKVVELSVMIFHLTVIQFGEVPLIKR